MTSLGTIVAVAAQLIYIHSTGDMRLLLSRMEKQFRQCEVL